MMSDASQDNVIAAAFVTSESFLRKCKSLFPRQEKHSSFAVLRKTVLSETFPFEYGKRKTKRKFFAKEPVVV
jgi:hypothetical protein